MNKDLEEQIKEMGPDYRAVVGRLRAAKTVEPCLKDQGRRFLLRQGYGGQVRSTVEWLIAASLLIVLCLTVHIQTIKHSNNQTLSSHCPREYRLTPAEMIATQRSDGSWQNDFLTRRNAEILARCEGAAARIAYKKALRNLRSKGIL